MELIRNVNIDRNKQLDNCTFIKTILMLLIVFYHSINYWSGKWFTYDPEEISPLLSVLAEWLNSFHIYGFVLVSGYIFSFLKYEKKRYDKFLPFLLNKFKRLIVPFYFVAVFWVVPFALYFFRFDFTEIIDRYILASNPNQLWFLWMLFNVFIIFWLLSSFFEKHTFAGSVVVIGMYGLSLVGSRIIPNYFMIWTALKYVPVFWLGLKLRQGKLNFITRVPGIVWLVIDIGMFAVAKYVSTFDTIIFKLLNYGCSFLLNAIGAIMIFVVLQGIANKFEYKNSKVFLMLAKYSMPIYLVHQQIIYVSISLFNGNINLYVHAMLNFVISILVSVIISHLLFKTKITRFLIGEK